MAKLGDFFQEGKEVLADITLDAGQVISNSVIEVPLSKAAKDDDIEITVLEEKGQAGQLDWTWNMRKHFHGEGGVRAAYDKMYLNTTEATDLQVRISRDPADTNQAGRWYTKWKTECRPASGQWDNSHNGTYMVDKTTEYAVLMTNTPTPPDTNWMDAWTVNRCGMWGYDDGLMMTYSTTEPSTQSGMDLDFYQSRKGRDKWNYYLNNTWMAGVNTDEVIFHLSGGNTSGYNQGLHGQLVEVDAANERCRGKGVTWQAPTSQYHRFPYDAVGNGLGLTASTSRYLTKGISVTKTTSSGAGAGTGVDVVVGASTMNWSASPAGSGINADYNHIAGGVLKVWDGTGDTNNYRVFTIQQANGTTNCTLNTGVNYGTYAGATTGTFTNYELWLWYDPSVNDGYSPIDLFSLTAGNYGSCPLAMFPTAWGSTSTAYRGHAIYPDCDDYTKRSAVIWQSPDYSEIWEGLPAGPEDSAQEFFIFDFSKLKNRDGTPATMTYQPKQFSTSNWGDCYYSPNGTDWYKSYKDPRFIVNNFQHTQGHQEGDMWWERRWVKYESGTWWANNSYDGIEPPDREVDPDGAKAAYESENWVDTGYTDPNAVALAIGYAWYNAFNGGAWSFPSDWEYNTRIVNNSDSPQNMWVAPHYRYADDLLDEFQIKGLKMEHIGNWGNINIGQGYFSATNHENFMDAVRWNVSRDRTTVNIALGNGYDENNITGAYSTDLVPFNKIRIVIKGTAA
jgi:hypothetical protein